MQFLPYKYCAGLCFRATASKFEVEEEFAEVVLGEGGAEEAFADAALVVMGLDALEGDFAQEGEVLRGEALAGAGGIFQEGDIQMPVELVLDGPVSAHEHVEVSGRGVVLVADEPAGGMGLAVAVVDLGGDLDQGLDVRAARAGSSRREAGRMRQERDSMRPCPGSMQVAASAGLCRAKASRMPCSRPAWFSLTASR